MVEIKRGLKKGSLKFQSSFPRESMVKRISKVFNTVHYTSVQRQIAGKQFGNPKIIDCAEEILQYLKQVDFEKNINQILNSYVPTDKTRN